MYRLWDRKTGAEPGAIKRGGRLAFSDDGKRLAITSSNHAELWRLERDSSATSRDQKITLAEPMDMIILPYFQWKLRVFFDTSIFTPTIAPTRPWGNGPLNAIVDVIDINVPVVGSKNRR